MGRKTKSSGLKIVKRQGSSNLHIQGTIHGRRIRCSTGTDDAQAAEVIRANFVKQITDQVVHGKNPEHDFNALAVKHLKENTKKTIVDDCFHIKKLKAYIGRIKMHEIYRGYDEHGAPTPLEKFILGEAKRGVSASTINHALTVINTIGNAASKRWRGPAGKLLLTNWISVQKVSKKEAKSLGLKERRKIHVLTWDEQIVLFNELPPHLRRMAVFAINTGCRQKEVTGLKWEWFHTEPTSGIQYFIIPGEEHKNEQDRIVILNEVALRVISQCKGDHPVFVFTYEGKPVKRINSSAFQNARRRAALRLPDIAKSHVHSWRHTFGTRLRNQALCPEEERKDLMGHKSGRSMTEHYSVPELRRMLEYCSKITHPPSTQMALVRNG
jgi:integrase